MFYQGADVVILKLFTHEWMCHVFNFIFSGRKRKFLTEIFYILTCALGPPRDMCQSFGHLVLSLSRQVEKGVRIQ